MDPALLILITAIATGGAIFLGYHVVRVKREFTEHHRSQLVLGLTPICFDIVDRLEKIFTPPRPEVVYRNSPPITIYRDAPMPDSFTHHVSPGFPVPSSKDDEPSAPCGCKCRAQAPETDRVDDGSI